MKVFAHIDGFRGLQPFPNWVARIALNTCYDQLRKQKVRAEVRFADLSDEDVEFVESIMAQTPHDAPAGPTGDGKELVDQLLTTLNPRERMVLQLMDLEKKSVRDVSDLTGWGESKIKVTAMRARNKLNRHLIQLEAKAKR